MSVRNADGALLAPPTAAPPAAPEGAWLGAGFSGGLLSAEPPRPPPFGPSIVALASEAARASSATGSAARGTVPPASQPGEHFPIEGPPIMLRPQPKLSLSARTVLATVPCSDGSDLDRDAAFTGASSVRPSTGCPPDSAFTGAAGNATLAAGPRAASGGSAAGTALPA